MNSLYKKELIKNAFDQREKEVAEYEVNMDNFSLAIEQIGQDPEMQEFKQQLEKLLASTLFEYKKSVVMLNVLKLQLKE